MRPAWFVLLYMIPVSFVCVFFFFLVYLLVESSPIVECITIPPLPPPRHHGREAVVAPHYRVARSNRCVFDMLCFEVCIIIPCRAVPCLTRGRHREGFVSYGGCLLRTPPLLRLPALVDLFCLGD